MTVSCTATDPRRTIGWLRSVTNESIELFERVAIFVTLERQLTDERNNEFGNSTLGPRLAPDPVIELS